MKGEDPLILHPHFIIVEIDEPRETVFKKFVPSFFRNLFARSHDDGNNGENPQSSSSMCKVPQMVNALTQLGGVEVKVFFEQEPFIISILNQCGLFHKTKLLVATRNHQKHCDVLKAMEMKGVTLYQYRKESVVSCILKNLVIG